MTIGVQKVFRWKSLTENINSVRGKGFPVGMSQKALKHERTFAEISEPLIKTFRQVVYSLPQKVSPFTHLHPMLELIRRLVVPCFRVLLAEQHRLLVQKNVSLLGLQSQPQVLLAFRPNLEGVL
jgi:hypothetical protein